MIGVREKISKNVGDLLQTHDQLSGVERICQLLTIQDEILCIKDSNVCARRLRFFQYELESQIQPNMTGYEKAEVLRRLVFEQWGFQSRDTEGHTDLLVLSRAIEDRVAHPIVLNLIFSELADHCDLKVEPVRIAKNFLAKIRIEDTAHYLDPNQAGQYLECSDLIGLLQQEESLDETLRPLTLVELVKKWLLLHGKYFSGQISNEQMILICDCFLTLSPNALNVILKRGQLLFSIKLHKLAWLDFKRYFLLADFEKAPDEVKVTYQYLKERFEDQPVGEPVFNGF